MCPVNLMIVVPNSQNLDSETCSNPSPKLVAGVKSRVSPWLARISYPLACGALIPGYFGKVDISGQHHLPTNGPVILAPTHRSRWDALLVSYATGRYVTGRDLRFMVSANEMKGIQGWFVRRLGGFPVDTKQPAIASLRFGVEALHDGEMMVIFPEGGIFRDNELHSLKPGLARLALQAELFKPGLGTQIVPMYLSYRDPFPSWNCDVTIRIGKPLSVSAYCQQDCQGIKRNAQLLTADITSGLQALGAVSAQGSFDSAIALDKSL